MKSRLTFQALTREAARLKRDNRHALAVLRECEDALEARGSYSPVRLAACIRRLAGKTSRPHVAATGIVILGG